AVGGEAPLGHPLGLALDRGERADGLLVQARRQAGHLDLGDEAGAVVAAQRLGDPGVVAQSGVGAVDGCAAHAVVLPFRVLMSTVTSWRRGGGRNMSASSPRATHGRAR